VQKKKNPKRRIAQVEREWRGKRKDIVTNYAKMPKIVLFSLQEVGEREREGYDLYAVVLIT
jgi:hypothetical protein